MISPIDQISSIAPANPASSLEKTQQIDGSAGAFGSIFRSAIDNVITTDNEKTQLEYQLSIGELDNPALLTISSSKYQIAVDLLIQLRNKALEAYSELTRISL